MKLAVVQHSPWEGPGRYLWQAADEREIELCIIKAWQNTFPDPNEFDGVILLGGGANVHEEEKYPFLRTEKKYLRDLLAADKPCLGICLGHQLLADSLGAKVGKNFRTSIGLCEVLLTGIGRRHPLFHDIGASIPAFKWHGQAVLPPLPGHFEILATSRECQVEAFSISGRPHLIGVQFDNHAAHPDDVAAWYDHDREWLQSIEGFSLSRSELLAEVGRRNQKIEKEFRHFFRGFCCFL